uniref:NADP-dependent oxidoreductase domain-containing protein n=1 Tax=Globisporangium ultimum (strain ATCC 200006 / CBS 805.95 / DAOM BR144) TaxID=431595 RepID=K3X6F4_GLOUD
MSSTTPDHGMKYRYLGNSGLLVSTLSLGGFTFDDKIGPDASYELMVKAFESGINFFDNAEMYGLGQCEVNMGRAIKRGIENGVWTREDLVITTKIFFGSKAVTGPNDQGLNRKHIVEGIKASLKRLQLDYVDVLLCHRPDATTPIEETVRAMNFVINQGWALYWGTSSWKSGDILEACEIADRLGLIRPVTEQPEYNIFERSHVEFDYVNLYKKYKLGLTTWSPLASGILTGKYSQGIPENSRFSMALTQKFLPNWKEDAAKADELKPIAEEIGCSLSQLAIAWCASNPNVSTVMLGASSMRQLEENLRANAFIDTITPEIKARIDDIVQFVPTLPVKDEFASMHSRDRHL